jgi:hypothetical protein
MEYIYHLYAKRIKEQKKGNLLLSIPYDIPFLYITIINMLFLIDENKKVIFGWSAKCGCSHIKNMFYYLQTGYCCKPGEYVHKGKGKDFQPLPENLDNYTMVLFIRNPYKRLVSGFLDKYGPNGEFRYLWDDSIPLTFSNFVDKIAEKSKMIDNHHFTPQTGEHFNDRIKNHSKTLIYDIDNIDYNVIGHIFRKELPQEVLDYRGEHCYKYVDTNPIDVYDVPLDTCYMLKPPLRCFYNDLLKEKVENIYKDDFEFFKERGFKFMVI